MLTHLIESQHPKQFHQASTLFSIVLHGTLIVAAIHLTTAAAREVERVVAEKITFAELKKQETPPPEQPKPEVPKLAVAAQLPAKGFQVLVAPVKIPDVLPAIDLSRAVTREEDFSGSGVAGGVGKGVAGGVVRQITAEQPYYEYEVEKAAAGYPSNQGPRYPEALRSANVEGVVSVRFIVDTLGRAEPGSVRIVSTTHELFAESVKKMIPAWRFYPAEIGGRKVRMLVEQPIEFKLAGTR